MAINDLINSMANNATALDDVAESKIISHLSHLMKDSNAQVQNLAVKW